MCERNVREKEWRNLRFIRTKYPLTRGDELIIWNNVNNVMSGGDRKHEALAECLSVSDGHYIVLAYINSK